MNRARFLAAALASTALGLALAGPAALAQSTTQGATAADLHPILAGRNITPPLRGEAQVDIVWPPQTRRDKDIVVTRFQVKNVSKEPIARFTVDIPWYGKDGSLVTAAKGVVNGLLQPNEVQVITVETAYNPLMVSNNYLFSHLNGSVKPNKVAKMEAPAPAAKAPAKPK
jgi:hypothetical protein